MTSTRTALPDDPPAVCAAIIVFAGGADTVRYAFAQDFKFGAELLELGARHWKVAAALDQADAGHDDPELIDAVALTAASITAGLLAAGELDG